MKLFKKYEFNSQEQAEEKIKDLGTSVDELTEQEYADHNHAIVKLGYLTIQQGVYEVDESGESIEVEAPVLSDKYSVDVLWDNLDESPYGWKSYEIQVEGNGSHTFYGYNFK